MSEHGRELPPLSNTADRPDWRLTPVAEQNPVIMSTADNFEVIVGDDGAIDPGALARYGVRPGEHLRIARADSKRAPVCRSQADELRGRERENR